MTTQDGFGNTPWGGIPVLGVTIPQDGYGAMGWGNEGEAGSTSSSGSMHNHKGLINSRGAHLTRQKDSGSHR